VKIFYRIVLPLALPAIASLAIFQFIWVWNDLLVALVFLGGNVHTPLTIFPVRPDPDHSRQTIGLSPRAPWCRSSCRWSSSSPSSVTSSVGVLAGAVK